MAGKLARSAPLAVLLPLLAFVLAPLVKGPMFASADGLLHLHRLVEFDQSIRAGILYPRWAPDLLGGYGEPLFIFYAPVLYYVAEAFHLVGLSFVDALKAAVAAGMAGGAFGMYLFGRDLWGRWGGLISAVAYVYVPYRLVNTYLDGELAQTLAWAWLPWLLWACWRCLRRPSWPFGLLAAVSYAGLMYTHSLSTWLFTPFVGAFLAGVLVWQRRSAVSAFARLLAFLFGGALLGAPYWLPALAERGDVELFRYGVGSYDFHTNLVPLARTFATDWAHNYAGYVGVNGPAQVGLIQAILGAVGLLSALVLWLLQRRRHVNAACDSHVAPVAIIFAVLGAASFVLMLPVSAPFWEHVPFGEFLQLPDRMLAPLACCSALLAGAIGLALRRLPLVAGTALAALAIGATIYGAAGKLSTKYIAIPERLTPRDVVQYEQLSGAIGTTAKGEYTPRWLGTPPVASPLEPLYAASSSPARELPAGQTIASGPESWQLRLPARVAGPLALPLAYYPGWAATIDGHTAPVTPNDRGQAQVEVPNGASTLEVAFGRTPDRLAGDALLVVGLAAVAGSAALRIAGVRRGREPDRRTAGGRLQSAQSGPSAQSAQSAVRGRTGPSAQSAQSAVRGRSGPSAPSGPSALRAGDVALPETALSPGYAPPPQGSVREAGSLRAAARWLAANGRNCWRAVATLVVSAAALALLLALWPGKLQLAGWPATRPMQVAYSAANLTLLGGDVTLQGNGAQATVALVAGASAIPNGLTARMELLTKDAVWASASQPLPGDGWPPGQVRDLAVVLALPAGTPAGAYTLQFELLKPDGTSVDHEPAQLSFFAPVIGPAHLGMLTLAQPMIGPPPGDKPAQTDFGPFQLAALQAAAPIRQGDFMPINLWWLPRTPVTQDLTVSVKVLDARGQVWAQHDGQPREGYNPTSTWQPGRLERDVQMVLLTGGIPPGDYDLAISWYDAASGQGVGPQGVHIGSIHILQASREDVAKLGIPHALDHQFPNGLELLGFDQPSAAVKAGQPLPVRLFWRVTQPQPADATLVVAFHGQQATLALPQMEPDELLETRLQVPTSGTWAGSGQLSVGLTGIGQVPLPATVTIQP